MTAEQQLWLLLRSFSTSATLLWTPAWALLDSTSVHETVYAQEMSSACDRSCSYRPSSLYYEEEEEQSLRLMGRRWTVTLGMPSASDATQWFCWLVVVEQMQSQVWMRLCAPHSCLSCGVLRLNKRMSICWW